MSKRTRAGFRRPTVDEQHVLTHLTVRLLKSGEQSRFNRLLEKEHYLHSSAVVGETLRYVATYQGQWLGMALWNAAAYHIKPRDEYIGWDCEQKRSRRALLAQNGRLLVLEGAHYPNLISRFMKLMLERLSSDWQERWSHPVVLAETFVDPQFYRGTAYKVSGWSKLGPTSGFKRSAEDFYQVHNQPKEIWVRELVKGACQKLRAHTLPEAWAVVEQKVRPHCTAKAQEIRSLLEQLGKLPDFRRKQALGYPLGGMLALMAMASFSGVARGYDDLAEYAATLSQAQLRALKFRRDPKNRKIRCPKAGSFGRVLRSVPSSQLEKVLLLWQEQVLGPVQDRVVIYDGKEIRHAKVELVSAVSGTGRWLGTTAVAVGTNEIPTARQQLAKMDLEEKLTVADALHTQDLTAQQILYEQGGDYLLSVKANQKELCQTLAELLQRQSFSPSGHGANTGDDTGAQPQAPGDTGGGGA